MIRSLLFLILLFSAGWAVAAPRVFAPVFLRTGSLNEVYVWDESPVGEFEVELRRPGSDKVLSRISGFGVDRPLPVLGASNRALKWSAALIVPDALDVPGPVSLRFMKGGKLLGEVESEIHPRQFPVEEIPLDKAMTQLRAQPDKRKDREAAEIWKVYQKFDAGFTWSGGRFLLPVSDNFRTSAQFGDGRLYLYSDGTKARDYHRGTDFAVPAGTPVSAAASGTAVLVADRMLTGTTIVLEHAPGVYSVYFHLSKALIKKNSRVGAGDRIALSGASGLVTGPHLHWEVRVGGVPVDALDLVTDGLLDIQGVSTVISSVERPIH